MPIKLYGTCKSGAGWVVRKTKRTISVRYTRKGRCVLSRKTALKVARTNANYYDLPVRVSRRRRSKRR